MCFFGSGPGHLDLSHLTIFVGGLLVLTPSVKMRMLDVSEVAKIQKKPSSEEVSRYFHTISQLILLCHMHPNCVC